LRINIRKILDTAEPIRPPEPPLFVIAAHAT
jgi:hypothetical protein